MSAYIFLETALALNVILLFAVLSALPSNTTVVPSTDTTLVPEATSPPDTDTSFCTKLFSLDNTMVLPVPLNVVV